MARENLKIFRKKAGYTQEKIAEYLGISTVQYQMIEYGKRNGSFEVWDALEDLLGVHQRKLRENLKNHPGKAENPLI